MTHTTAPLPRTPTASALPPPARGLRLSRSEFTELADELDRLRAAHRADLAQRLRDARAFGSPGDDDDWLSVMEDAAVERGRIAQLERLMAAATVVDDHHEDDAAAGPGATVRVRDDAGRTRDYALVGRLGSDAARSQVSVRSPVGTALLGARAGDMVRVTLPSGRQRSLHVLEVRGTRADRGNVVSTAALGKVGTWPAERAAGDGRSAPTRRRARATDTGGPVLPAGGAATSGEHR